MGSLSYLTWSAWLFVFFNAVIVTVYFMVMSVVVPAVSGSHLGTRIFAVIFCTATSAHYFDIILRTLLTPHDRWSTTVEQPHVQIIRAVQAISLVCFVFAYRRQRQAERRAEIARLQAVLVTVLGSTGRTDSAGT